MQRNSLQCRLTMETAPVENSEYSEEPVAKKLTSVQTAKPNAQMYFAIAVAMVEAMMFGLIKATLEMCRHMKGDRTSREFRVRGGTSCKETHFSADCKTQYTDVLCHCSCNGWGNDVWT